MTSTPDARLLQAHDLARAALAEITPPSTVGDPVDHVVEGDGAVSLRFANRLRGYPGWLWTVTVAAADADAQPTVLEVELLPGDGALVAPDWVPWAVRLADYQAAQAALAEAAAEDADDEGSDDDDDLGDDAADDDLDDDELDDLDAGLASDGSPILHAGDLDGVDIDELDADEDAEADEDDAEADEDDAEADDDDAEADEDDAEADDADRTVGPDGIRGRRGDQPSA